MAITLKLALLPSHTVMLAGPVLIAAALVIDNEAADDVIDEGQLLFTTTRY